jgi:small redox-active disulfide protein 2
MKIEVLGSGCPTCKKLFELTKQAVQEMDLQTEVEYSNDIQKMLKSGAMSSPVLMLDNEVISAGQVPNLEEIKNLITKKTTKKDSDDSCSCKNGCC